MPIRRIMLRILGSTRVVVVLMLAVIFVAEDELETLKLCIELSN